MYTIKVFNRNDDIFVVAQQLFQHHFNIHQNDAVLSANAIKTWEQNFETTGSALKKKPASNLQCMLENIDSKRAAMLSSPKYSACCYAVSLGFFKYQCLMDPS